MILKMLDERKERALTALLVGEGPTVASQKANVSRTTIYTWLQDSEFSKEIEIRKKEIVSQGIAYVVANNQSHLEVIHDLAMSKTDKRTALAAAMYLVDRAMGKTATKIAIDNEDDKDIVSIDILEAELKEFEREENN
jgi:butyrate kinase